MKQYDLELNIIGCIFYKPELINELFIDMSCFKNSYNKQVILLLKKVWENENSTQKTGERMYLNDEK